MTTSKQRNERLLQVVRVLKELPKGKRFDLGRWYTCGTVACAIGWAASDPWFTRRGFKLERVAGCPPNTHRPVFKGRLDFRAVETFFGTGLAQAKWLFVDASYPHGAPASFVIQRIEKYVRDNPA